uniref:AIP/AIPL N-terminal FKBP-type PPIase domain-containing protein n=1 Tax=Anabas testudineus TaxID=64144 RepID=A0A3Q1J369_ANATE
TEKIAIKWKPRNFVEMWRYNFERTVIDDSRLAGRPAEIFVGKMFKMEVWETLLTSMRVGEVAEFWCDAIHTGLYPIVSKGMRLIAQGKDPLEGQRHMCGMGNLFHYHSTGFPELDELMRTPQPLIFIMELLQVGDPMSYHRESWMMEKDEKLQTVPVLHMQGNALVKQRQFREAASKYKEAVLLLKTVQSREMPGDIDYINLGRMIIPLELNYCQCMLELEEYYEVIEHTTELLEKHKDCVKAYYKRAKAHAAVWNEKEARRDFNTVAHLDITLASLVNRELKALSERMKENACLCCFLFLKLPHFYHTSSSNFPSLTHTHTHTTNSVFLSTHPFPILISPPPILAVLYPLFPLSIIFNSQSSSSSLSAPSYVHLLLLSLFHSGFIFSAFPLLSITTSSPFIISPAT